MTEQPTNNSESVAKQSARSGVGPAENDSRTIVGPPPATRSHSPELPKPIAVSVDHAGVMLGVSRRTVYRLIGLGHLKTVRLLRAVRIPVDSIQALIAKGGVE